MMEDDLWWKTTNEGRRPQQQRWPQYAPRNEDNLNNDNNLEIKVDLAKHCSLLKSLICPISNTTIAVLFFFLLFKIFQL